jgi:hypothetical protein
MLHSVADPGCLSRIRLFCIPDPNCLHPGSRIRLKEFKYFNPKKTKKWFLSSRKYDLGCSSRIQMLTFYPSRIPDPGVKKGTGSRIRIRNTDATLTKKPNIFPRRGEVVEFVRPKNLDRRLFLQHWRIQAKFFATEDKIILPLLLFIRPRDGLTWFKWFP